MYLIIILMLIIICIRIIANTEAVFLSDFLTFEPAQRDIFLIYTTSKFFCCSLFALVFGAALRAGVGRLGATRLGAWRVAPPPFCELLRTNFSPG